MSYRIIQFYDVKCSCFCDAALHDDQTVKHKWTLVNADFVIRIDNGNMFDQLDLSQLFNNLMLDLELAVHVLSMFYLQNNFGTWNFITDFIPSVVQVGFNEVLLGTISIEQLKTFIMHLAITYQMLKTASDNDAWTDNESVSSPIDSLV
ncbi:hypothetical protein T4D_12130 [Trichinella pseudospiralis]|uniref:Uncharacterized protein n=1 Tax=Trichinella pseudospiralis TaxID=6337 RepID=A0A0V1FA68_TRIPS|nr:hypothetical protein T4D_12130 [Trichinella pseudospiralis]